MLRAYKTELHPNNKQRTMFVRCCGAARFIYNWALADRKSRYESGESTNKFEQKRRFNGLKNTEYPWIQETPYKIIDSAFDNLDRAYQNFFHRVKAGDKPGFPKFKSRKNGFGTFKLRGSILVEDGRIRLPRIGWVHIKEHGYMPTVGVKILSVTISECAGRWYASLQVEEPDKEILPSTGPALGIDVGLKHLAVCSDGTVFDNPRPLKKAQRRLRRQQRELSRRQKGSKNREKARHRVAKTHARIANIRRDAIHKLTHHVTAKVKPSVIVLEDLNVAGMMKNHCLAGAIADASLAEIRRQIQYKAQWYGIDVVMAGRFYPSSKTCSACGSVKPLLRLSDRTFVCEKCGTIIDRDLNAAINLMQLSTAKHAGSDACGEGSFTASAGCPSVKQEPGEAVLISPGWNS